ncbi:MAG TPA: tRNA guanosine(34) transglycosylase Tgt [Candidatus Saccharimonadia bacterium]
MAFSFHIHQTDGASRRGTITTPHGPIETPAFIPVGTQAAVKTLDAHDLQQLKLPAVLANTYHLYLRPGVEIVERHGGLHAFMQWDGPTFTDSGGFQVFSLGFGLSHGVGKISTIFPDEAAASQAKAVSKPKLMKVDDDGVSFRSHIDGSPHRFTAESSIGLQQQIGADIILAFDECTSPLHDERYTVRALERTHAWAKRSLSAWSNRSEQALYGIVQGGAYKTLRLESAAFINNLDFPGHAIGGSLGRSKQDMYDILEWTTPQLDARKPRHLLGIGEIEDLFAGAARGMDTFDCVAPTRIARNGAVYISPAAGGSLATRFRLNISAAQYADDSNPIDPTCECQVCQTYSRAYLRHLFNTHELLSMRLATIHNLYFVGRLMEHIRKAIEQRELTELAKQWGVARLLPH